MITYNPKDWFRLIFRFHSSDTFRILLPTMLLLGLFTALLVHLEQRHNFGLKSAIVFHQILGFVLSMLLVFRINTAYERWWEGRKLWGSLVNNSRSLATKFSGFLRGEHDGDLRFLTSCLAAFPFALRDHLRGKRLDISTLQVPPEIIEELSSAPHQPLCLYSAIIKRLGELRTTKTFTDEHLLLLNPEVFSLIDITGACERIKASPIPFSYSLFLKKIIFAYVITMPITFSIEYGYWAIPAVVLIFYAFASLEIVSEEVEEPFGTGANDLPTDELSEKIRRDIEQVVRV